MSINPQFSGGPTIPETPEALKARKRQEEKEARLNTRDVQADLAGVKKDLGYGTKSVPEEDILKARLDEQKDPDNNPDILLASLDDTVAEIHNQYNFSVEDGGDEVEQQSETLGMSPDIDGTFGSVKVGDGNSGTENSGDHTQVVSLDPKAGTENVYTSTPNPQFPASTENSNGSGKEGKNGVSDPDQSEQAELLEESKTCEYSPLIKEFVREGNLTTDEANQLIGQNINADNYEGVIAKSGLGAKEKVNLNASIKYLCSGNHEKEMMSNLQVKLKPELESFMTTNGKEFTSPHYAEAFTQFSRHFIGVDKSPEGIKKDINLAFEMAANTFENKAKLSLNSSNEELYHKALTVARDSSKSFKQRFAALGKISEITNNVQGRAGKLSQKEYVLAKKRATKEGQQNKAFQEAQAKLSQDNGNNRKIARTPEVDSPKKGEKVKKGEVASLGGGKLDTSSNGPEQQKKAA